MGTRIITVVATGIALFLAACSSGGSSETHGFMPTGPAIASVEASQISVAEYKLGAFDKIGITVYQMPDLSFPEIQIDTTGQIVLPQVGVVPVMGKTITQVGDDLKVRLSQCCLVNPQVIVTLREAVSQQITVSGAVRSPNNFPIRGRTTLLQAIAMANGPDQATADTRAVGVIRKTGNQQTLAKFDLDAISRGQAPDPEILPGDTIFVETSNSKSAFRTAIQSMPFFGVFTLF